MKNERDQYWKDRSVAITGGGGFIGSHTVEALVDLGAQVKAFIRPDKPAPSHLASLADRVTLLTVPLEDEHVLNRELAGIDTLLHLAGHAGKLLYSTTHHATRCYANLRPFLSVLEASRLAGVRRFLVSSSACVYPDAVKNPMPEDEGFTGMPARAHEGYGMAKRMQEYLGTQYAKEYGMETVIARPFNVYGPRSNFAKDDAEVIPSLIRKVLSAKTHIDVWGSGQAQRSFIYVDDVVCGILAIAENGTVGQPINIGSEESTSVADLAKMIIRLCGRPDLEIHFDTSKPEGTLRRSADTTLARTSLGLKPSIPLEEGIRRTIAWFRNELSHGRIEL